MLRPLVTTRFRPEALFRPASVLLVGPDTPLGRSIEANMAGFTGRFATAQPHAMPGQPHDLAVLACAPHEVRAALLALGAAGTMAAVCATPAPDLLAASEAAGIRVLGPASFGIVVPALGLNASSAHVPVLPGKVALLSQSAALCRAVLDWAAPNGVGFSHVIGTGGNAQTGFSAALDYLSRDPGTGAILLDIRSIRDRRSFLAAARAAARLRPVVAIHAGGRLSDPSGRADAVLGAALRRAGVLRVSGLAALLGAAETLTRARPPRSDQLVIVTNAIGPAHFAADAAVALGIPLLQVASGAQSVLRLRLPPGPEDPGIVWTGSDEPTRVAEAAAMMGGVAETGGVVAILAPTGPADAAAVAALAACRAALRVPLLACVLGETTGAAHRRTLADAGVPVFATPEAAVQAFAQLVQQRQARAAAAELPPRRVLPLAPDRAEAARLLDAARADGRLALRADEADGVLAAYGIATGAAGGAPGWEVRVTVADDPWFGPAIGLGEPGTPPGETAYELPPLNLSLARALVLRSAAAPLPAAAIEAVADALVRISQLVIDLPALARVDAMLATAPGLQATATLELRPPGEAGQCAIAAYPEDLARRLEAGPDTLLVRPIRPEDAEAHAALFRRLTPEDIRYRFFNILRDLPPEQIVRMTQVDYDREMAFVAVHEASGHTVGVGRLIRDPATDGGEFAVLVEPAAKGRGVARFLMQQLVEWGRSKGMGSVTGLVLAENAPMLAFMRRIGATIQRVPQEPEVVEAVIPLH